MELVRLKCIQRVLNPHLASPLGAAFRQLFADKFTNDCFNPMIQHFICLSSLTLGWDVEACVLVELGVVPGERPTSSPLSVLRETGAGSRKRLWTGSGYRGADKSPSRTSFWSQIGDSSSSTAMRGSMTLATTPTRRSNRNDPKTVGSSLQRPFDHFTCVAALLGSEDFWRRKRRCVAGARV